MKERGRELLSIIERFSGAQILVVGDLILDHYIWGKVERISPEAPVVVVQVTREEQRPGGAGNVVNNLLQLGAKVSICGVVGDDDGGRSLVELLRAAGADVEGVLVDRARRTTIKTRVIAQAQQVVRVDREDICALSPAFSEGIVGVLRSKAANSQAVVLSDYAKGTINKSVFDWIEQGYEQGVLGYRKVPVLVDPKAANFSLYSRATVVKPNRAEAEQASALKIPDRSAGIAAGKALLERWNAEALLITLGEDGMVLVSNVPGEDQEIAIETVAREVFDVSGAGDTVSAVFSLGLAVKANARDAAELANIAAGIVVGEIGTVAVRLEQLRAAIGEQYSRNAEGGL